MPLRSAAVVLSVLALLSGIAGLATAAPLAAAPTVRFDAPVASGDFGQDISFSTTFTADAPPIRVELLARRPGDTSDRVTIAAAERMGDSWRATVVQGGHVVPNTSWDYRFRAVTADGDVLGPSGSHRVRDTRFEWERLEGEHVDVWTYEGGQRFAQRASDIAEAALVEAAEMLGVNRVSPVDFFVYTDTREFRQAMGPATRENIGGQAHPAIRTLFALIEPRQIDSDWVEEVIRHELAHLVFHDAVDNPYQYPPRWLNEGVAVYLSRGHRDSDRAVVEGAARGGTIIPLEGLTGQFPTRAGRQSLAYAESIDAVEYFVATHGEAALAELVRAFKDGLGLDGAFGRATGQDFAAFDTQWLASLGAEHPPPYGPVAVEPGPVPDDWTAAGSLLP